MLYDANVIAMSLVIGALIWLVEMTMSARVCIHKAFAVGKGLLLVEKHTACWSAGLHVSA